jgi:hypothetical protein
MTDDPQPIQLKNLDRYGIGLFDSIDKSFTVMDQLVSTDWLKALARELLFNVTRCYAMVQVLPVLAHASSMQTSWDIMARFEATGVTSGEQCVFVGETAKVFMEKRDAYAAKFQQALEDDLVGMQKRLWSLGTLKASILIGPASDPNEGLSGSIEAILYSVVLGLWTAFEIFSSEVWIVALNEGPKQLAENVFKRPKMNDDEDITNQQAKQIPLEVLKNYEYDLSSKMGDLLRDTKKVDFQSIYSTALAYATVFGSAAESLFDVKQEDYANIIVLSEMRNVILHNANLVDEKYRRSVRKAKGSTLSPVLSLAVNEPLPIQGSLIRQITRSIGLFSTQLLKIVSGQMPPPETP